MKSNLLELLSGSSQCSFCPKTFVNGSYLQSHLRRRHASQHRDGLDGLDGLNHRVEDALPRPSRGKQHIEDEREAKHCRLVLAFDGDAPSHGASPFESARRAPS